ncbi:MAG: MBL fold metallo-hydrolase [archaeon]|nr:MAG: MBL fold metallo-hydrolase [archaeon]
MKINDSIFLIDGAEFDSNMFCINNELLIDCGSGMFIKETLDQMEEYGLDPKKIKTIVITHAHFDHCGGTREWKRITGARVLIHERDREALESGKGTLVETYEIPYEPPKADKTLKEGDIIKTGKYSFEVIHTAGHTPGGICLWDSDNKILISGDTLFIEGVGRTDLEGGDDNSLKKSLQKIKNLGDIEILLPGHGAPASRRNIYAKDAIKKALDSI